MFPTNSWLFGVMVMNLDCELVGYEFKYRILILFL